MPLEPRTTRERSPWALISLLLVVLLFGLFWLWQERVLSHEFSSTASSAMPSPSAAPTAQRVDLTTLEANALNIAIPHFESLF